LSEELKSCPHCGHNPMLGHSELGNYIVCHCISPQETKERALKKWNTRTPNDSDKVKEALKEIKEYIIDLTGHIECYTENINGKTVIAEMTKIQTILKGIASE